MSRFQLVSTASLAALFVSMSPESVLCQPASADPAKTDAIKAVPADPAAKPTVVASAPTAGVITREALVQATRDCAKQATDQSGDGHIAAGRAKLSACQKKAADDTQSLPDTSQTGVKTTTTQILDDAKTKVEHDGQSYCGSGQRLRPCFYVGVFVAGGSVALLDIGHLHGGKTAHTLVSTAIPALGVRFPIDLQARFSFEFGALSMLLSKDVAASHDRVGCRKDNGDFEKHLPCEGSVALSPLVGVYGGLTAGTPELGVVTLMPMVGAATTSLDGSVRFYGGLALGLVNLSKTFNF